MFISSVLAGFAPAPITPSGCNSALAATCRLANVAFQIQNRAIPAHPRCSRVVALEEDAFPGTLDNKQIEALFREFDTSGDGLVDLSELQAALSKAGTPVSAEAAEDILKRVRARASCVPKPRHPALVYGTRPGSQFLPSPPLDHRACNSGGCEQ